MAYNLARLGEIARSVALAAPGIGQNNCYKLGAIIFDNKGRVQASGHNSNKTHPFLASYGKQILNSLRTDEGGKHCAVRVAQKFSLYSFQHAETAVILNYGIENCRDKNLIVVRVNSNRQLTTSKPCFVCQSLIDECLFNDVYYISERNEVEKMKEK